MEVFIMENNILNLSLIRNRQTAKKGKKPISMDKVKYFTEQEIKLLRRTVRNDSELALSKNQITAILDYMIIDLLTCTGLRVSECANLIISDLIINHGKSEILVRHGKCGITGTVIIPLSLKKHLNQFIAWKKEHDEPVTPDSFLFIGQRGHLTSQGIQRVVKKYLKKLNLYETGKSVHSLRHSYAVQLYSQEKDLLAVKKQLRHTNIQSTLVYADICQEELQRQVKGLWN
jgi:site-specific recombinase XerD